MRWFLYSLLIGPTRLSKIYFNINFNRFNKSNSTIASQRFECRKTCNFQFHFYTPSFSPPFKLNNNKNWNRSVDPSAIEPPIFFLLWQPLSWCILFFIYLFLYLFFLGSVYILCVCPLSCYYTVHITKQPSRSMPVFNIDMSRSGCAGRIHTQQNASSDKHTQREAFCSYIAYKDTFDPVECVALSISIYILWWYPNQCCRIVLNLLYSLPIRGGGSWRLSTSSIYYACIDATQDTIKTEDRSKDNLSSSDTVANRRYIRIENTQGCCCGAQGEQ